MAIYLIGGPPKCGKTTLAKALSKEFSIPWISADTLENIVSVYTAKEQHAALFPHAYLRGDSNDEFYSENTPQAIVEGYVAQGKATYAAIEMMAETYLKDKDDFIVEGYQVTPEVVNRIIQKFGAGHVKAAFLIKEDEKKMVLDFHKSTTPNDWILRKTKDEATYQKIAAMIMLYSNYFKSEAKRFNQPIFQMDADFNQKIETIIKYLRP